MINLGIITCRVVLYKDGCNIIAGHLQDLITGSLSLRKGSYHPLFVWQTVLQMASLYI